MIIYIPWWRNIKPNGYIYIQTFEGPKTEPWGTPQVKSANSDVIPSI